MAESDTERSRLRRAAQAARERIRAARQAAQDAAEDASADSAMDAGSADDSGRDADAQVPYGLRVTVAWTWRLLVLAAGGYVLLWLVGRLSPVLIPVAIALLLSALLAPAVGFFRTRMRMPASLATAIVLVGGLAVVAGTLTLV
ncbi:MAG TPA: hypothetical protein VFC19_06010, partial [Candidatus Limnocylindrales bacterium]|nr:hypothetical protein [Candidatus Limnocylindrales bacterium]